MSGVMICFCSFIVSLYNFSKYLVYSIWSPKQARLICCTCSEGSSASGQPWAFYQICKILGCTWAGNARERFRRHRFLRNSLVSDPGMHQGTCVTHAPWWMTGYLTRCGGESVPGIPDACAILNFSHLARGPLNHKVTTLWHTQVLCHMQRVHAGAHIPNFRSD